MFHLSFSEESSLKNFLLGMQQACNSYLKMDNGVESKEDKVEGTGFLKWRY